MSKVRINNSNIKNIEPFEHLGFVVKNTTPSQRFKWLEQAWNLWHHLRNKVFSQRVIEFQDKFREGKI